MISVDACECQSWHKHFWDKEEGHTAKCERVPFVCGSWRHEGPCQKECQELDFYRILTGLKKFPHWVYIVLTFHFKKEHDRWESYVKAGKAWDKLRKRLDWRYGRAWYIQTWERHKKGGCHCNLVLANEEIYLEVLADWRKWRKEVLKPHAVASGFGYICWVQACDWKQEEIAGYLAGKVHELSGAPEKGQVPLDAPPHFRRIRSSPGLLPPLKTVSAFTGQVVRVPVPKYNPCNGFHSHCEE
jgi:hypothetical protein